MDLEMLQAKIHRATVTRADLHYVGSLTLDADLIAAAGILPGQKVDVVDIDNGARLSTYVIEGPAGSGTVGINGAAARLISPGDLVIIIAYARMPAEEARRFVPSVVFVDERNRVVRQGVDPAEPLPGTVHGATPDGGAA
ncbi:aspartate 1-decarboxylase [Actinoalloteichus sp. AHMU CJ021]|uniref:Aspartate 1-decarboxylase n=1 Tax=Actinoalloteichus caeruleus DSM 43889 TaxID=1120930 RepID=A0ABT1JDK7_ACTCY|nr:aspartate 1-decarboxylase [Actinoalloteichus caeruleus]AUS79776.1 aspartate 1-decarboxylase [Actinoalloteichus sp. AHMU CJ021]MCP2330579.1 L-aspartate 1-decarboxylase [Actinoalloteichus caeruleus DSM 43889]